MQAHTFDPSVMVKGRPNFQNVAGCAIHSDIVRSEKMVTSGWWSRHQKSLDDAIVKRVMQTNSTPPAESPTKARLTEPGAFPRQLPHGSSPMFDPAMADQHYLSTAHANENFSKSSAVNAEERFLPPPTWRFGKKGIPVHYGRTLHGVSSDGTDTSYRAH